MPYWRYTGYSVPRNIPPGWNLLSSLEPVRLPVMSPRHARPTWSPQQLARSLRQITPAGRQPRHKART